MGFRNIWRYVRLFFSNKQDRLDADLVRDYYSRLLDESAEEREDAPAEALDFSEQEVYGRIREAMSKKPEDKVRRLPSLQVAASILTLACVATWYWWLGSETASVDLAMKTEYNALQGEIKKLTLPDGTKIWLNSGSTISYFADNAAGIRKVELRGEAYFDVVPDERHPLVVHTEKIAVMVLGTSFNVRAHGDEENTEVFVTTGTVHVSSDPGENGQDDVILRPNQQVKYDKGNDRFMRIDSIDAYSKATWVTGNMRYQTTPLRVILGDLERRFHIDVNVDYQLADCLITVDFGTEGPAEALEILASVLAGRVQYDRGIYKLKGTPCN